MQPGGEEGNQIRQKPLLQSCRSNHIDQLRDDQNKGTEFSVTFSLHSSALRTAIHPKLFPQSSCDPIVLAVIGVSGRTTTDQQVCHILAIDRKTSKDMQTA